MTKQYPIISLNGEMYMVEKPSWYLKQGEWIVREWFPPTSSFKREVVAYWSNMKSSDEWRILATTDKKLGLPLLPSIEEDIDSPTFVYQDCYLSDIAIQRARGSGFKYQQIEWAFDALRMMWKEGFKEGYKAASKKQYTEEDMKYAYEQGYIQCGINTLENDDKEEKDWDTIVKATDRFVKSLKPIPTAVEVEMECWYENKPDCKLVPTKPKVDKQGFIIVKRWIYEN